MEIRFSHVEVGNQKDLCFVLPNESISAIAGEGKEEVLKLIGEEFPSKGNIYYNGKRKLKRDQKEYVKDIKYIPMNFRKNYLLKMFMNTLLLIFVIIIFQSRN